MYIPNTDLSIICHVRCQYRVANDATDNYLWSEKSSTATKSPISVYFNKKKHYSMCNVYFNFSFLFQRSCRCLTAGIDIKASVPGSSQQEFHSRHQQVSALSLPQVSSFLDFYPFYLFLLMRRSSLPQSKSINAYNGNPGFFGN